MRTYLAFLFGSAGLLAQQFHTGTFHGRRAYVLENDRIRIAALRGGGHIAEIRFKAGDSRMTVNPMRVPHYQTIEPYEYDPARHDALYGANPHRWLSSGYMGHLLCFPVFGPPSSESEIRNGLGNHGEAPIVEWTEVGKPEIGAQAVKFRYAADLGKTQFRVERTLTLDRSEQVLYVEEWVENLALYDRPINWVQHATFGPPFIAPGKATLDMSGGKGQVAGGVPANSSLKPNSMLAWPEGVGREGSKVSLRPFQPVAHAGTYFAVLMDQGRKANYFTMYNPDFKVLIGYLFETAACPWIGDWQENEREKSLPWSGKVVARGLEFGSTPFAEGLKKSVERGSMFGVPTFRWIGGRQRLKMTYVIFLAEIPDGFAGVADVATPGGQIVISERGTNRRIALPAKSIKLIVEDSR